MQTRLRYNLIPGQEIGVTGGIVNAKNGDRIYFNHNPYWTFFRPATCETLPDPLNGLRTPPLCHLDASLEPGTGAREHRLSVAVNGGAARLYIRFVDGVFKDASCPAQGGAQWAAIPAGEIAALRAAVAAGKIPMLSQPNDVEMEYAVRMPATFADSLIITRARNNKRRAYLMRGGKSVELAIAASRTVGPPDPRNDLSKVPIYTTSFSMRDPRGAEIWLRAADMLTGERRFRVNGKKAEPLSEKAMLPYIVSGRIPHVSGSPSPLLTPSVG